MSNYNTENLNSSSAQAMDRVSRRQFLRLSLWLTVVLCLVATVLPLIFGRPAIWSMLEVRGLLGWESLLSGVLGGVLGGFIAALIIRWQPLYAVATRLASLVAWEEFRTADYVLVALMAAWGEELLFRGALQPLIGLLPAALIFGLSHATAMAHIVLASLLGALLGWIFRWSGSLWPPIAAHLAIDLVTGLILVRRLRGFILLRQGKRG